MKNPYERTYEGVSDNGSLQDAIDAALAKLKPDLGEGGVFDASASWVVSEVSGVTGGVAGYKRVVVTITAQRFPAWEIAELEKERWEERLEFERRIEVVRQHRERIEVVRQHRERMQREEELHVLRRNCQQFKDILIKDPDRATDESDPEMEKILEVCRRDGVGVLFIKVRSVNETEYRELVETIIRQQDTNVVKFVITKDGVPADKPEAWRVADIIDRS